MRGWKMWIRWPIRQCLIFVRLWDRSRNSRKRNPETEFWLTELLSAPPLQRLEHAISTPVNFVILPIFAFVNAQVRLVGVEPATLLFDPVALGVYFGMLLGKPIGIAGMTFIMVKAHLAELPAGVRWPHIVGMGILGGIGFTMSILIAGLAFTEIPAELLAAKTAILAGSVSAAVIGLAFMALACRDKGTAAQR